jgi:hypothetical protein
MAAAGVELVSSAMVFQAPHESHLPCQRPNTVPQFWQTKAGARRDMGRGRGEQRGVIIIGRKLAANPSNTCRNQARLGTHLRSDPPTCPETIEGIVVVGRHAQQPPPSVRTRRCGHSDDKDDWPAAPVEPCVCAVQLCSDAPLMAFPEPFPLLPRMRARIGRGGAFQVCAAQQICAAQQRGRA